MCILGRNSSGREACVCTGPHKHRSSEMAEEPVDIDLTDPDVNKAATKIQAVWKGRQVRADSSTSRIGNKTQGSFMVALKMLRWKNKAVSIITKVTNWGYLETNGKLITPSSDPKRLSGPEVWHKAFPVAKGVRQSPIDICTPGAVPGDLPPICAKYEASAGLSLTNTGATWMVKFPGEGSSLTGGALHAEYKVNKTHRRTDTLCHDKHSLDIRFIVLRVWLYYDSS